ncbi:MAG TPA: GDP-mannose 4,6-dehydratase [Desulfomonilaceae bacterium]|nr:GDP-mannose 4,6-dehydratase [Desulfomonilaceae bacterium]
MTDQAIILGIGGQDGYFMSNLLAGKGVRTLGLLTSSDMDSETVPLLPLEVELVEGSISDRDLLRGLFRKVQPNYIFNFAGISFIPYCSEAVSKAVEVNGVAVSSLLEILVEECPKSRFFQAGSSEMFGHNPLATPQNEQTPFCPDNPYGIAKVFAANMVRWFRSHRGLFACTGILYNHESPWRRIEYVTRKITTAASSIKKGLTNHLELGDIRSVRDWSYAGDIVEAMWLSLQAEEPRDYVLASGTIHSVENWLDIAFSYLELDWRNHVTQSADFNRPIEPIPLCGDPALAKNLLGWRPRMTFEDLVRMMVDADLQRLMS